jgi:hypothetical protein
MNEGAKGETSPKARIAQELIYLPGHLNYSSKHCKNTILLYKEIDK